MAGSQNDGGGGREAAAGLRAACETGPRKKDKKRKRRRRSKSDKAPPPHPPPPSQEEHRATSSTDDGLDDMLLQRMRDIVAMERNSEPAAELFKRLTGERDHSVENTFGDSDDGSLESLQARKVALLVSKSITSLSSYAGGKRIRVCSGFVMCLTDNTGTSMILTSATLIRSLNGDNNMIPNVKVKVLLSDGHITDGHIFIVDFHYNIAVVKVAADLALLEVVHLNGPTHNGAVLALGRAYEGGNLMCSRGQVVNQTSIFGCSELLVSSCKISMAGSGGPLLNYNGQVLGINFYEKIAPSNADCFKDPGTTPELWVNYFIKIISPWLGLKYTSLHTMPLRVLDRIYQKFPYVDQGLYISNVVNGSPADVAGLCNGDVLVECNGKVLSGAPEFGAVLLDVCKEHLEASGDCAGETMTVEVVIKRQGDGSTVSKTIAAEILKESHYNRLTGERDHSVENTFGDSDDGSLESLQARKVALLVSKSITSLSSYAGGKRIRVCSGFVMCLTDNTGTSMILTSATLIRSLNGDNNMIPNVKVKVLLSDGHITDGHIFIVDFHYNIAVVKVAADLALLEVVHLNGTTHNGAVLALGRAYEGGNLMCSRGQVVNQTSIFGCSELLVSSCKISMAGSGGPLLNYNGQVLGINFYEKNQTSHLPMLIVSRILEQHQSFGKIISPWLGLKYTSFHTMPLRLLDHIYQKFPYVDQGLYISNVVNGSPADVAGLCNGDVLVECNGKVLSGAPEFGAVLLDVCKEHLEASGDCAGETMTVEVVIKRQRDGSTVSKTIAAEILKESHYNRWPAPMPRYKVRMINIGV